jgi:hypothetical protein
MDTVSFWQFGRRILKVDHWFSFSETFAPILKIFFRPVEIGVQTQIMVAIDPDLERDTGKYFAYCKATTPAQRAIDYNLAKWLWEKSAELTGLEVEKQ